MNIEVGKALAPETPASAMQDYIAEHITALMTLGGIESISAQKYTCGFGSRLHVSMAPFANAPKEITAQGVIMKDAIAQIMSVANITRIVMKLSELEMNDIRDTWENAVASSKQMNGGSGQDFSGSHSKDNQ